MSFLKNLTSAIAEASKEHSIKKTNELIWDDICRAHKHMFLKNIYEPPKKLVHEFEFKNLLSFSNSDGYQPAHPYIDAIKIFENHALHKPNLDSSLTTPIEVQLGFYIKRIPYIWHENKFNLKHYTKFKEALYKLNETLLFLIDDVNFIDNKQLASEIEIFGNDIVHIAKKIFLNIYYTTEYGDYPKKYEINDKDNADYGIELIGYLSNLSLIEVYKQKSSNLNLTTASYLAPNTMVSQFGEEIGLLISKIAILRYTTYTRMQKNSP